jgi:hypothetical protein
VSAAHDVPEAPQVNSSEHIAAMHAALRFVLRAEIPAEHRAVLIEVLTQSIRQQEAETLRRQEETASASKEWMEHELTQLRSFLHGKVARGWQPADEYVMHLAAHLHRDPKTVRAKAIELGLGAAVDYRIAKMTEQGPAQ